jgi:hypothetical protein
MDRLQEDLRLEAVASCPFAPDAFDNGNGIQQRSVHIEKEGIVGPVEDVMESGHGRFLAGPQRAARL